MRGFWFLVSLSAVLLTLSCDSERVVFNKIDSIEGLPQMSSTNTTMLYSDSSVVRMKVVTPYLESFYQLDTPYSEFSKGLKTDFFTNKGHKESALKAGWAKYIETLDLWEFKGDVELINKKRDTLRTVHLFADRKQEKLYTDSLVVIISDNGATKLTGKGGFKSNFEFTDYIFDTRVVIESNDKNGKQDKSDGKSLRDMEDF